MALRLHSTSTRLITLGVFIVVLGAVSALTAAIGEADEPATASASDVSRAIDRIIDAKLAAKEVTPAPRSGDAEFFRRLCLDVIGRIPTPEEVAAFVEDRTPDKRARQIEVLLAGPEYADYWGTVWFETTTSTSHTARGLKNVGPAYLRGEAGEVYLAWLQDQIATERPYDEMVRAMIAATGRTDKVGPGGFLARWSENANVLASQTAKIFLGTRIACAECHDHVYEEDWKQADFQGMAAFFSTTIIKRPPEFQEVNAAQHRLKVATARHKRGSKSAGPASNASESAREKAEAELEFKAIEKKLRSRMSGAVIINRPLNPGRIRRVRSRLEKMTGDPSEDPKLRDAVLTATTPKFWLGAEAVDVPGTPRRTRLANWVTAPANRQFDRTLVNRYWGAFFGLGFVHPVDDFGSFNEASHEDALELLARDFTKHGYDLKRVVRVIVNTAAYQRTSKWAIADDPDPQLFSRAPVRSLTTEQLCRSLVRATGLDRKFDRTKQRTSDDIQAKIISAFSYRFNDDEGQAETTFEGSIRQGLFLINGEIMDDLVRSDPGSHLYNVLQQDKDTDIRVARLFMTAYARAPRAEEAARAARLITSRNGTARAFEDLWWSLLNSSEFVTNH